MLSNLLLHCIFTSSMAVVAIQQSSPEVAEALEFYANQAQANYSQVKKITATGSSSWVIRVGEARYPVPTATGSDTEFRTMSGPFLKKWTSKFVLEANLVQNSTITRWKHLEGPVFLDPATRKIVPLDGMQIRGVSAVSLQTRDQFISKQDHQKPGENMPNSGIEDPGVFQRFPPDASKPPEALSPETMFRLESDAIHVHEQLLALARYAKSGDFQGEMVKGNSIHRVTLSGETGDHLRFDLEFSPACDFMLTGYSVSGGPAGKKYSSQIKFRYRLVDNVWVPCLRHAIQSIGGKVTSDRTLEIDKVELSANPSHGFTLASLNPKDGDVLVDKIEGKVFLIEDGVGVAPEDFGSARRSRFWFRFALGVVVIAAISCFFWFREQHVQN